MGSDSQRSRTLPKGVMLAHRSLFAVAAALREAGDPWIGWSSGKPEKALLREPYWAGRDRRVN